jgi:hypothetical protein
MTAIVHTKFLISLCSFVLTWLLTARASGAHVTGLSLTDEAFPLITIAGLLGAIAATCACGL